MSSSNKKFICDLCNKSYARKNAFDKHYLICQLNQNNSTNHKDLYSLINNLNNKYNDLDTKYNELDNKYNDLYINI